MRSPARPCLGHQIQAPVALDKGADLGLGDADQDDGFGMLDQPDARDLRIGINGDQRMNGLARIAGGADEIGCDKGPGDRLAPFQDRGRGHVVADRAKAFGAGNQVGCDLIGKKIGQDGLGGRRQGRQHCQANQGQNGRQQQAVQGQG